MVALKRSSAASCWSRAPQKQERRGGIETGDGPEIACHLAGKQERRGGIETEARGSAQHPATESRNAVVALKPKTEGTKRCQIISSRNAVVALKPPRWLYFCRSTYQAGTPWWH